MMENHMDNTTAFKNGDKVKIKDTLTYNDRIGRIVIPDNLEELWEWDYIVDLEPTKEKPGRMIGIFYYQAEKI